MNKKWCWIRNWENHIIGILFSLESICFLFTGLAAKQGYGTASYIFTVFWLAFGLAWFAGCIVIIQDRYAEYSQKVEQVSLYSVKEQLRL